MIEFEDLLGFFSFPVKEYVPPAKRCFKCQHLGLIANQFKGKERCARCGGQHEVWERCQIL